MWVPQHIFQELKENFPKKFSGSPRDAQMPKNHIFSSKILQNFNFSSLGIHKKKLGYAKAAKREKKKARKEKKKQKELEKKQKEKAKKQVLHFFFQIYSF